ncbi:MAG: hypothetical protein Q7R42_05725 [Candidatus Planktophila sp.]|nr:hypothetical protein [Candidatus Planktophila sp.]
MITAFIITHTLFAVFLGRLFALAPDEGGYIFAFNTIYQLPISTTGQSGSGWITAPTIFLWIVYLPAKILNIFGVPDYLSIRMLSILLTAITLYLLLGIQRQSKSDSKIFQKTIFLAFFIPSVFLWTSVGLRESFIIAEMMAFLAGLNFLMRGRGGKGAILLFLGSYGLVSTKNYLWVCLMVALILSSVIFLIQGIARRQIIKFVAAGFLVPLIAFASTTSAYALDFILHGGITEVGARSGDSISQVYVDRPGTGTGTGTGTPEETVKELITFHGDYTLIALRFYLIDNPNALFSKISRAIHLDKKIESIWNEKVALGLVHKDKQVGTDTSSLNGHILEPAKISEPLSLLWPAFVFLCGPFPFIGNPGIAVTISSFESPLWWALYALVIFQFIRFRKIKFMQDPQIIFTLIFLAGEIAFSALVEVNLGTSFRHRSILLVPLVFLFVRLAQRAKEQIGID